MAFLAIPSNDPSNNNVLQSARTSAQILSYLSVVTSFGSMLLGLMLAQHHKAKGRGAVDVDVYVSCVDFFSIVINYLVSMITCTNIVSKG